MAEILEDDGHLSPDPQAQKVLSDYSASTTPRAYAHALLPYLSDYLDPQLTQYQKTTPIEQQGEKIPTIGPIGGPTGAILDLASNFAGPEIKGAGLATKPLLSMFAGVGAKGTFSRAAAVGKRIRVLSAIKAGQQITEPRVMELMENLGYAKNGKLTASGEQHLQSLLRERSLSGNESPSIYKPWSSASLNSALKLFNEAKAAGKGTEEAYRAVSEKIGRSVDAIKKKFVAEGVFTPTDRADYAYQRSTKPTYPAQPGLWDNPENDAQLETLFKKGMSFDDIARELKTSRGAVAGRLKRRGMLGQASSIEEQFRDPRTGALTRTEPGMRKPSAPAPSMLPMMSDADIRAGESIQRYLLTPVEHDPFGGGQASLAERETNFERDIKDFLRNNDLPDISDTQMAANIRTRIRQIESDRRTSSRIEGETYPPHGELSALRRRLRELESGK